MADRLWVQDPWAQRADCLVCLGGEGGHCPRWVACVIYIHSRNVLFSGGNCVFIDYFSLISQGETYTFSHVSKGLVFTYPLTCSLIFSFLYLKLLGIALKNNLY